MTTESDVRSYFENLDGTKHMGGPGSTLRVTTDEVSHSEAPETQEPYAKVIRARMRNIPYSGGAHMMPNGFGILEFISDNDLEYETEYFETDETHRDGRTKKGLDIYVYIP